MALAIADQFPGIMTTAQSADSGRLKVDARGKKDIKAKKIKFLKSKLSNIQKAKKIKNIKYPKNAKMKL